MVSGHTYSPTISSDENYIYTIIISRENIITEILTELVIKMMEIMIMIRQVIELMESELVTILDFLGNEIINTAYKENYDSMVKINIGYGFTQVNYCQSC